MSKKDIKEFFKNNKEKVIFFGGVAITSLIGVGFYCVSKRKPETDSSELHTICNALSGNIRPILSRAIPETEGFKILDIAEDVNDGCIVWLDDCKLSDCGKLGEGLSKIENVDSEMLSTMIVLAKDKIKL